MSDRHTPAKRIQETLLALGLILGTSACQKALDAWHMPTMEGTEEEWTKNVKKDMRYVQFDDRCTDNARQPKVLLVTAPDGTNAEFHQSAHGWWRVGTKAKTRDGGRIVCSIDQSGTGYKQGQHCTFPCE